MTKRWKYFAAALVLFLLAEGVMLLNIRLAGSRVIVYMYHSVREDPVNPDDPDLSVRPSELEKQLRFFKGRGIRTVFASELAGLEPGNERCVALTFDDGYEDNYTEVFPLLKKYGCKATVFMITGLIDQEGYLTADEIREMTDSGLVSVQSHTVSHEPLALGDKVYEEVVYEMEESQKRLEAVTGAPVDALAIPNGSYDGAVLDIAGRYYDVIFTGTDFRGFDGDKIRDIHRVGIYRYHTVGDIRRMTDNRGLYLVRRVLQKLVRR